MAWMDCFADEMNTSLIIYGKGTVTGKGADGQPTYSADVKKFDGVCAFWRLSASEVYQYDRVGNPSTHQIVINPADIIATIKPADWAVIGGGKYDIYTPDDILQLGDVNTFTVSIQR